MTRVEDTVAKLRQIKLDIMADHLAEALETE